MSRRPDDRATWYPASVSWRVIRLTTSGGTEASEIMTPVALRRFQDVVHVIEVAQAAASAAWTEVVRPDETDCLIAELRPALGGVQQADGVGVRADDDDPPPDPTIAAHARDHSAGDRPLDDEAVRTRTRAATTQRRERTLNWATKAMPTMAPTLTSAALTDASALRRGVRWPVTWYSLLAVNATIHTGKLNTQDEVRTLDAELGLAADE